MNHLNSRRFNLVFLAIVFAIGVAVVSSHRAVTGSSDFDVYYQAGKSVLEGKPIYTIARHAVSLSKSPFVYPPFFACLISSLSLLPIEASASIWNLLNLLFFAASFLLIHSLLFEKEPFLIWFRPPGLLWKRVFWVVTALILFDNIAMAQVNIFVLFLILLGIERFQKKREIESGVWIGVATAVKLIPLIFFVYFLIKRKWRVASGGFAAFLICFWLFPSLVVGHSKNWEYHRAWFQETIHDHTAPKTLGFYASQLSPSHQNLQAVLFRLVIDWEFRERTGGPNGKEFIFRTPLRLSESKANGAAAGAVLLVFLFFCFVLLMAGRDRDRKGSRTTSAFFLEISMVLSAMLLLSPKARSHFFVFLCFPWVVLLKTIICEEEERVVRKSKRTFWISIFLYFLQGVKYLKFMGAGCFSSLVLFLYFAAELLRKRFPFGNRKGWLWNWKILSNR